MRLPRVPAVHSAATAGTGSGHATTWLGRWSWLAVTAVAFVLALGIDTTAKADSPYVWKDPIVLTKHPGTGMGSSVDHVDARFEWREQPGLYYVCSIDGGPYELCQSGKSYENLSPGRSHYFQAYGCETPDNCGPHPHCKWAVQCTYVSYTWLIERGATRRAYSAAPTAVLPDLSILSSVANGVAAQVSMLFGPLAFEPGDLPAPTPGSASAS